MNSCRINLLPALWGFAAFGCAAGLVVSCGKNSGGDAKAIPKFEEVKPRAEAGDVQAQATLGDLYANGQGVTQNYTQAAKWYQMAAAKGNPAAETALGDLCEAGQGLRRDMKEAAKWYQQAAQQGYARAQYNLATLYTSGEGVALNVPEALKWYGKAADQGDSLAQFNLGMRYLEGKGVAQNPVEAWKWLSLAEANGVGDATAAKRMAAGRMNSDQLRQARDELEAFQKQAAAHSAAAEPASK
ncbi:MAG TPA: tetratricopeptide repeat protein [Verrucomicrobiae bacterium]|nr:tetratricopeptide repeat protein [Verrucomicrobiae bacterium]